MPYQENQEEGTAYQCCDNAYRQLSGRYYDACGSIRHNKEHGSQQAAERQQLAMVRPESRGSSVSVCFK